MNLLNIGCGAVFHPAWINLDSVPVSGKVTMWNVDKGLPFANEQIDVCYASHVLEHLTRTNAQRFILECIRVLKPGGIIRLAVPDLEAIVRQYLVCLDRADQPGSNATCDYEWIVLEMLDQMVRNQPGGEMFRYLTSGNVKNREFVVGRCGAEAEAVISNKGDSYPRTPITIHRVGHYVRRLREELAGWLSALVLGAGGYEVVREGLFRRSGQLHLWMYDRYSLRCLLQQSGFTDVLSCSADESRVPDWQSYELDMELCRVRKPDSLFMEAIKP